MCDVFIYLIVVPKLDCQDELNEYVLVSYDLEICTACYYYLLVLSAKYSGSCECVGLCPAGQLPPLSAHVSLLAWGLNPVPAGKQAVAKPYS